MTSYCLAVMKSLGVTRVVGELWYLRSPMKILRCDYTRQDAEARIAATLSGYAKALASNEWPHAERSYCDAAECGFRTRCWSP
jgi:hypothetical protein